MTESGADQRARGGASNVGIYRDGLMDDGPDLGLDAPAAANLVTRGEMEDVGIYRDGPINGADHRYGWVKLCRRSELWAAIEAIEDETDNLWRCPFAEAASARARLLTARNRVRALLGLEPES